MKGKVKNETRFLKSIWLTFTLLGSDRPTAPQSSSCSILIFRILVLHPNVLHVTYLSIIMTIKSNNYKSVPRILEITVLKLLQKK